MIRHHRTVDTAAVTQAGVEEASTAVQKHLAEIAEAVKAGCAGEKKVAAALAAFTSSVQHASAVLQQLFAATNAAIGSDKGRSYYTV